MLLAMSACLLAGSINGAYATPIKKISGLKLETIWFYFSFVAFFLMPMVSVLSLNYHAFRIIGHVPPSILVGMVICGFLFGCGMNLFAYLT